MIRKTVIALAALAAVGAAVFAVSASTSASADGWRNHRNHHYWRPAIRYSAPSYTYGSCIVRRVVPTPYGPRVHFVNVCG